MSNNSISVNRNVLETLSRAMGQSNQITSKATLLSLARLWIARTKQRRQLAKLPPHLLRDIGISARDAAEEAAKPFWEA